MNMSLSTMVLPLNTTMLLHSENPTNSTTLEEIPSRPYPHPVQVVVMWTVSLLMILLNLLVFVVAPRMKNVKGATTKCGILSLAISDFSLGIAEVIGLSYNIYTDYQLQTSHLVCVITGYSQALFAGVSIMTLTFMNVDRVLTFAYPLRYRITKRTVITIQVVIWVSIIALLMPTAIGGLERNIKYYDYAFICLPDWAGDLFYKLVVLVLLFFIPTIVIVICFCASFYYARSRHRQIHQQTLRVSNVCVHYGRRKHDEDSQWKRDRRIFKTLAIMTFGFYFAWLPYLITIAIPEMIRGQSLHPATDFITPWLAGSNSFWNPIIYILIMKPFSNALSQLWRNTLCVKYTLKRTEGGSVERDVLTSSSSISAEGNSKGVSKPTLERQPNCTRF